MPPIATGELPATYVIASNAKTRATLPGIGSKSVRLELGGIGDTHRFIAFKLVRQRTGRHVFT
jgi:hypothetical protein